MDVIEKKEISNILILVIRYFGGILLGANGLVRAYSSSASEVLNNAIYYKKKKVLEFDLTISYKEYDIITKIKEITILDSLFLTDVFLHLAIDYEYYDKLKSILISNKILSIPSNEKITYKEIKAL